MKSFTVSESATMSSREIAVLTTSRHADVIRSILRLMDDRILTTPMALSPFTVRGKEYHEYYLEKRDSLVVVAQISPQFMAAVVDRWQELESQTFNLPTTMAEALRLAADQADKIEEQAAKIAEDAPKVEFVNRYVISEGLRGLQEAAKSLGFKPRSFTEALKQDRFLYKLGDNLTPYQQYIDRKLFKIVEGERNDRIYNQTKITAKGMNYFASRYATELGE